MNNIQNVSNKSWFVYEHVAPNGNRYIGITSNSLQTRSGKNGYNYLVKRQDGSYYHPIFASAIKNTDGIILIIILYLKTYHLVKLVMQKNIL